MIVTKASPQVLCVIPAAGAAMRSARPEFDMGRPAVAIAACVDAVA
jgi:hypothetical protein